MRVLVLTFHPESADIVAERLRALYPHEPLQVDYVYPSIEFEADAAWDESLAAAVEGRLAGLTMPVRLVHVKPGEFLKETLGAQPPALAVVAYTQWNERVAMTANMLAIRQFPTLLLGYES